MKRFYLKQKVFSMTDRYKIFSETQDVLYYCKAKLFSIHHKMDFIDASNDETVYRFKRRLFRIMPTYLIYDNNGQEIASIKRQLALFRPKLKVETPKGELLIEGTFYQHSFGIMENDVEIASIQKKWIAWGDTYEISVDDDKDEIFLLALVILVDSIFHNRKRRQSQR